MNKFLKCLSDPYYGCSKVLHRIAPYIKDDELYVKMDYFFAFHKKLDLKNPKTFNEKLQWLKLNNRHIEYSELVDKYTAKQYVARIVGDDYIIPTLGIYESFDEIDFDNLPRQFVMKCTHDSGGVVVCKEKNKLDLSQASKKINNGLRKNCFWATREYPYKSVKPRIIIEQYLEDESGYELKDYKFFCFNGEPKFLFVATDRGLEKEETKFDFFDLEWNHLPFTNGHPNSKQKICKPQNFAVMIELSRKLSQGFPHVRVDLYNVNGRIYFGELTFFHWSGLTPFVPEEWDYRFGEFLHLPK